MIRSPTHSSRPQGAIARPDELKFDCREEISTPKNESITHHSNGVPRSETYADLFFFLSAREAFNQSKQTEERSTNPKAFSVGDLLFESVFHRCCGFVFAPTNRSNSFQGQGNSYKGWKYSSFIFNALTTAPQLLIKKPDEVARNGVLQRITSARGFL